MRKYLALAAAGALMFGVVGIANAGEETQTEEATFKPTKLPKKGWKAVKFVNTITTFDLPGTNQPPKGERTILDLPKQFRFNTKPKAKLGNGKKSKIKYCKTNAAGLEGAATTEDAVAACGNKSLVSDPKGSSAVVRVGNPLGDPTEIPVDVSAFNDEGKTLLLFSKPTGNFSGIPASILVGKLKKFGKVNSGGSDRKQGGYKESLDVTIPPLAAGAIAFFEVTIKKSGYIEGKCKPKNLGFQATTFFGDAPASTDTDKAKCKVGK